VTLRRYRVFAYGGITLCAGTSQSLRLTAVLSYSSLNRQKQQSGPTTPITKRLPAITRNWFGLFRFRSPLLTESRLLSLPVGTEMFHFPTFPPHALYIQAWVTGHDSCRVSPFGNPRIKARSAAPLGLSQPPTSFIGSWCQGIHRAPLLTWPQRCSRPLCSSQGTGDVSAVTHRVRHRRRSVQSRSDRDFCFPVGMQNVPRCSNFRRSLRTQQRAYGIAGLPRGSVPASWAY
jgi:hypothetical protein